MKECQFCHAESADNAVFCKNCGKRLDGKVLCPSCGRYVDGDGAYCEFCGARIDGKPVCSCGEVIEDGNFCPRCGKPVGEIKYKPANAARCEVAAKKDYGKAKRILEIVGTSLASFAVLIAFIAAFCVRVTATATGDDLTAIVGQTESESIFYYFGKAYADIADILAGMTEYNGSYATGLYVSTALNTVVGIAMLACVIVGTIMSIIAFVKFMTRKTEEGNLRPAVFTVISLIAGAIAFQSLNYVDVSAYGTMDGTVKLGLSSGTEAGLTFAALFLIGGIICKIIKQGKDNLPAKKLVCRIFGAVGALFCVIALSSAGETAIEMKATYSTSSSYSSRTMSFPLLPLSLTFMSTLNVADTAATKPNEYGAFYCGIISAVLILITILFLAFVLCKFLRSYKDKYTAGGMVFSIIACACSLVALVVYVVGMANVSKLLGTSGVKYNVDSVVSVFVLSVITLVHSVVKFILSKQIEKQAE